jgi:hypothetical protein
MTTIWICFGVCCLTLLGYVLYALHDIGKDDPETSCERHARTSGGPHADINLWPDHTFRTGRANGQPRRRRAGACGRYGSR